MERYINALDGRFGVLKECFGATPLIQNYCVAVGEKGTWYVGEAESAYRRAGSACSRCHQMFRDVPQGR